MKSPTFKNSFFLTCGKVKHPDSSVIRTGSELVIGGTEAEPSDWVLVCLEHLHVVHVTLPVLYKAIMISRHHPCVIVTPHHGSH